MLNDYKCLEGYTLAFLTLFVMSIIYYYQVPVQKCNPRMTQLPGEHVGEKQT